MKIALLGITGKMGHHLAETITAQPHLVLAGGVSSKSSSRDLEEAFKAADVLIDFSRSEALETFLEKACHYKKPMVIATTGITSHHKTLLEKAAKHIPLLYASNTSIGITLLTQVVEEFSARLGAEYDIEIVETHHREKVDAPSGTALTLGKAAAIGRNVDFEKAKRVGCEEKRQSGDIGFAVMRGGGVFGEHTVRFLGEDEVIDFSHTSLNRRLFAKGAIKAAEWLVSQSPGLYAMRDVFKK